MKKLLAVGAAVLAMAGLVPAVASAKTTNHVNSCTTAAVAPPSMNLSASAQAQIV